MASYWNFLKHPGELIGSLWDHPQPAAAPEAAKAAAAKAVDLSQSLAPNGVCGWTASDTGVPNWVCQAFGQVMPGIVFMVSLTVLTITLIFLFRYFLRSRRAVSELRTLLRQLDKIPAVDHRDWAGAEQGQQILKILGQGGKRLPPLKPLQAKIEGLLVPMDEKGKVALSRPLNDGDDNSRLIRMWTGESLADQMPAWLTAIGLLTTFLAILMGLQNVRVMSNMEVQGIAGLVNGLSGKFFSSIVALGCAVSVTIFNYFWSERVTALWMVVSARLEVILPAVRIEKAFLDLLRDRKQKLS